MTTHIEDGELPQVESKSKRLRRFVEGPPLEAFGTVLNSMKEFLFPQLERTLRCGSYDLFMLGSHSIVQFVGEYMLGREGEDTTRTFLERFVDGTPPNFRYSECAEDLHKWRNAIVHKWLWAEGRDFELDDNLDQGARMDEGVLRFNPLLYGEQFLASFEASGALCLYLRYPRADPWEWKELAVGKYKFIVNWLWGQRWAKARKPVKDGLGRFEEAAKARARAEGELRRLQHRYLAIDELQRAAAECAVLTERLEAWADRVPTPCDRKSAAHSSGEIGKQLNVLVRIQRTIDEVLKIPTDGTGPVERLDELVDRAPPNSESSEAAPWEVASKRAKTLSAVRRSVGEYSSAVRTFDKEEEALRRSILESTNV